jgi:F-type H+-transporting ATPase subunit alpha
LAQYDDLVAFAQFASDLDKTTQAQLARGVRLRGNPQAALPFLYGIKLRLFTLAINGYLDDLGAVERKFCAFNKGYVTTWQPASLSMAKLLRDEKSFLQCRNYLERSAR